MKKQQWILAGLGTALGAAIGWAFMMRCHHKFSRPWSNMPWRRNETYVVCLSCGKEFEYDSTTLTVGDELGSSSHKS